MLAQLRIQYPQSCLISELLEIKHGKYIVRALVQIEGVAIATGLGSGETVEIAEDHARERVLAILDLGARSSTQALALDIPQEPVQKIPPTPPVAAPVITPPVMTAVVTATVTEAAQKVTVPAMAPVAVVAAPVAQSIVQPIIQPVFPETKVPEIIEPEIIEPEITAPEITAPEITVPEIIEPVSSRQPQPKFAQEIVQEASSLQETKPQPPIPTLEKIEKSEKVVPLHIVPDTQPTEIYPQPVVAVVPDPEPLDFGAEKQEKKAKAKTSPVAIPDIKDVMAKTEIEIRRLGWTTQQGRNFLLQRYGKRARTLLSDEELLDFLSYLEDQPVAE